MRWQAKRRHRAHESGFTLMEMLVVLVVIALIAAVAIPQIMGMLENAKTRAARIQLETVSQALKVYNLDNDGYPTTEQGLRALVEPPAGLSRPDRYRQGGYIRRLPEDPWGNPYQYANPGRQGRYDVYSFGADGAPGGEGDGADIGNWN